MGYIVSIVQCNNITNRQTLDGRQDVMWKKEDAVVTPSVRPRVDVVHTDDVFQTPLEERKDGPPSEGKRLAKEMHAVAQRETSCYMHT